MLQQPTVVDSHLVLAETTLLVGVPLHLALTDNIVHHRLTDVPVSCLSVTSPVVRPDLLPDAIKAASTSLTISTARLLLQPSSRMEAPGPWMRSPSRVARRQTSVSETLCLCSNLTRAAKGALIRAVCPSLTPTAPYPQLSCEQRPGM